MANAYISCLQDADFAFASSFITSQGSVVAKLASGRSASRLTGILFQHMYTDNEKNCGLYSAMIVLLALFLTIIFYF